MNILERGSNHTFDSNIKLFYVVLNGVLSKKPHLSCWPLLMCKQEALAMHSFACFISVLSFFLWWSILERRNGSFPPVLILLVCTLGWPRITASSIIWICQLCFQGKKDTQVRQHQRLNRTLCLRKAFPDSYVILLGTHPNVADCSEQAEYSPFTFKRRVQCPQENLPLTKTVVWWLLISE